MTISSLLTDITNAIEALSINGVTIKDIDQISAQWKSQPNVLYPNPEGFLTNFTLEYQSFTRGASSQVDIKYTLNYRFLGVEIGDLSNMPAAYSQMVDKVILIINAMITATAPYSGRVDMELAGVSFGARVDPAGNGFHGADIALNITEMQNT